MSSSKEWLLPSDLISVSTTIMRPNGLRGCEGLALWFGNQLEQQTKITHVVALHGPGIQCRPLQLQLSYRALEKLTDLGDHLQAHLVGQIHSHPDRFLDLSEVDRIYGIRLQDYLSLVCPHYAQADTRSVDDCGVHVFDAGGYRRLPVWEASQRLLSIVDSVVRIDMEVAA